MNLRTTVLGLAILASAAFGSLAAQADSQLDGLMKNPSNWAAQAGDYANHRYSPLKQINENNVGKLQVAWTMSTGVLRGHEGAPLVIGDTMYIHSPFPNKVIAINLKDQTFIWQYQPKQDEQVVSVMCCDTVNRGLAYGDGKIFLQQADTKLVALNAKTGDVVWTAQNGNPKAGETNTNAPHVFGDKVLTGISGGEFGVRGRLIAYDIKTGKPAWTAFSTGPDKDMLIDPQKTMTYTDGKMVAVGADSSLKSWKGDQWKLGGGTTWGWYAWDPKLNLIYYGTGNPGTWNPTQRPGDEWDYDGVNEMILSDLNINGKKVPSIVHFDRNGFGYTLNRETGQLLVAQKYDPAVNWADRVDMKSGLPIRNAAYSTQAAGSDHNVKGICPAALGSKDQQPAAFDPGSSLFLVPTNHVCMDYEPFDVDYVSGQPYVGATLSMYPGPNENNAMGNFIAWDASKGKIVWSKPEKFSVWSGVLATAGGVAFYGTLEGYIKAVRIKDGKELWRFKTPSGIIGNVFTYEYQGKQFIGVYSGIGGWAGIGMAAGLEKSTEGLGAVGGYRELAKYTALGGTLFVFAIPGEKS
jgi:glucose dehydrogenase